MNNKFRLDDILSTYDSASWMSMYNGAGKVADSAVEDYNSNYVSMDSAENVAWNEMYNAVIGGKTSTLDADLQQVVEKWNDTQAWNKEFTDN